MHFSFYMFLSVSRHIAGPIVCISHFPRISVFSRFPGQTVCVSFSMFFSVSQNNLGPKVCISHISPFSTVSRYIPCPRVCVSHFPCWSVFSP